MKYYSTKTLNHPKTIKALKLFILVELITYIYLWLLLHSEATEFTVNFLQQGVKGFGL